MELTVSQQTDVIPAQVQIEPGYYSCHKSCPVRGRKDYKDTLHDATIGWLVYATEIDGNDVELFYGQATYQVSVSDFFDCFSYQEFGAQQRAKQMIEIQEHIAETNATMAQQVKGLVNFNPHIEAGEAVGTEIVKSAPGAPVTVKIGLLEMKQGIEKIKLDLAEQRAQLKSFLEEQNRIAQQEVAGIQAAIAKAEEGIWTVDLYLGTKEEIKALRDGEPAPADTIITFRQQVLAMDEEVAVTFYEHDEKGLDFTNIAYFDKWLLADPANLDQVLPEKKGVVALKPRRNPRTYERVSAHQQEEMDKKNRQTYFLIRNGERLFRLWTNFDSGWNLTPRAAEYDQFYRKTRRNRDTGQEETVTLTPGSADYMSAEKEASTHQRHYMRMALMIQGIFDRTTVLQPLANVVNVTDPDAIGRTIAIVSDADKTLDDGHERFVEWYARVNEDTQVGQRIIGNFSGYETGLNQFTETRNYYNNTRKVNTRLSPETSIVPPDDAIYTVEGMVGNGNFVFLYDRSTSWQKYEKRAKCEISPTDDFWLNIDNVNAEELNYFLRSRLDRHAYQRMIPLLKIALKLKGAEEAAEAPFKALLVNKIADRYDVDESEVIGEVEKIIVWYKAKYKVHRALLGDESGAYRDIMEEYRVRRFEAPQRTAEAKRKAMPLARQAATYGDLLYFGHKKGAEYIAYVAENDSNIFVREQIWTVNGLKRETRWQTVSNRWRRWEAFIKSERFGKWKFNASINTYMTDPELQIAADYIYEHIKKNCAVGRDYYDYSFGSDHKRRHEDYRFLPLSVEVVTERHSEGNNVRLHHSPTAAKVYHDHFLTTRSIEPKVEGAQVTWERKNGELVFGTYASTYTPYYSDEQQTSIRSYPENTEQVRFEKAQVREASRIADVWSTRLRYAKDSLYKQNNLLAQINAFDAFMKEYGGRVDLWEGHKKTLKFPDQFECEPLFSLLLRVLDHQIDPHGLNVAGMISVYGEKIATKYKEQPIDVSKIPAKFHDFKIETTK